MLSFKPHLIEEKGLTPPIAHKYQTYQQHYITWLQEKGYEVQTMSYAQLMNYIDYLQEIGKSKRIINDYLRAVSHYHNYLQVSNIARDVRLRGEIQEAFLPLTEEELEIIYHSWKDPHEKEHYHYSNQLILGLVIYQAVKRKEVFRIELDHLNLKEGTIYITGGAKIGKGRTIPLASHQIIPFYEYIHQYRGKSKKWQHQLDEASNKLFSPNANTLRRIEEQFKLLNKQIRVLNPTLPVFNMYQLRQSRLAIWIKKYGVREAQYLGGFSRVTKVERYQNEDVEGLKEVVNKYHPLLRSEADS